MQSQIPKEEIEQEDLIYKKATQQLKEHQSLIVVEESNDNEDVPFREFYKNVRSNVSYEEEIEEQVSQPENVIKSYIEKLSDGLEPEPEQLQETELSTDPEKLGKFKKYFVKEEEPQKQTEIQEASPPKLTLREKLELKKKQAQQPPVVAAIQLKQEEDVKPAEPSVAKTTLMKKIEEFKKLKQQKEQEEQQKETIQIIETKQPNPAPPNALRKLLNEKAQQKTQQIAMTQEIEQKESVEQEVVEKEDNKEVQFNENTDFVSDEPVEFDLNKDESHQEYFALESKDRTNINDSKEQSEFQVTNKENTETGTQDQEEINVQNSIEEIDSSISNSDQPAQQIIPDQTEPQTTNINEESEQNIEDFTPEISAIPSYNQAEVTKDQINNESETEREDIEQPEFYDNPNLEYTLGDQQVNESVTNNEPIELDGQNIEQEQVIEQVNKSEIENDQQTLQVQEENGQISQNLQNQEILEPPQNQEIVKPPQNQEIPEDPQQNEQPSEIQSDYETPNYYGYVEEHNVEVNDYLSEIDEAEKLKKIRQVEYEIEQKEVEKDKLEEEKKEEEIRIQNLQIEQQKLAEEENQQQEKIEEVNKEINLEEEQLKSMETDQAQATQIKNQDQINEFHDDESQNGFSIDDFNQQQQQKPQSDEVYSQSQALFKDNEYTTQVGEGEDAIIEVSQPAQLEEVNVDINTLNNQTQLSKEIQVEPVENTQENTEVSGNAEENQDIDDSRTKENNEQNNSENIEEQSNQNNEIEAHFSNQSENYDSAQQDENNQIQSKQEEQIEVTKEKDIESEQMSQQDNFEQESENINETNSQLENNEEIESQQNTINETENQVQSQQLDVADVSSEILNQTENETNSEFSEQKPDIESEVSNKPDQQEQNQLINYISEISNETNDDITDTPMMITQQDKQLQTQIVQDPEIQEDQVEIVQLDDYNQEKVISTDPPSIPSQLTSENVNTISQIQSGMKFDDTIAIEHIEFEPKLINQNKRTNVLVQLQVEDYDEEAFQEQQRIEQKQLKLKKQQRQKALKERESKLVEQQKQAKILEQQQQEVLRQQQQLIDLQNKQLLNKQKYKKMPEQKIQQIQLINQKLDQEFSFQQIVTKVDIEPNKHKRLRGNSKHAKFTDINFFQLTEKQQSHNIQSQDLFEAIKNEMMDCEVNHYTENLCNLCQTDVVYEINDDNWYLIGIAYGLKRHFQNLLNTIQFHFKNSKIYTSFNKESQVCVTLGDTIEITNLEEILSYYNNSTLPFSTSFAKVPQKLRASYAQMIVDLNQHKFLNFSMEAAITSHESYNGFTITEQHVQISDSLNYTQVGTIKYPGAVVPYRMHLEQHSEELQVDLNSQIYESVLANYLSKSLLGKVQIANVIQSTFTVKDDDESLEFEITIQK